MITRARSLLLVIAAIACLVLPAAATAAVPIEHATLGPAGGNGPSHVDQGRLSADGNCAVFKTTEKLLASDPNSREDIYERCGTTLTLVSIGPAAGAGTAPSPYLQQRDVSANGCVLFGSNEPLTDDDGDSRIDLFKRCGATIERVSQGPTGGNVEQDVQQGNMSANGLCVAFTAHEKLTGDDGDDIPDWFKRCGSTTKRVSQGPAGGDSGSGYANFEGITPDGSCVLLSTGEKLTSDDTDSQLDIYKRCDAATTKASPGNGAFDAYTDGLSTDGSCVHVATDESLAATDTDTARDVYKVCGADVTHVSAGGNGPYDANTADFSNDMRCVVFETIEPLTADDTDTSSDVYKRCGDTLFRVSRGDAGGNAEIDAEYQWLSRDGRCDVFTTEEHITADDADASRDVFKRCGSTTTRESQGPAGGNASGESEAVGLSYDGERVLFRSNERLTTDDTDDWTDIYERGNGVTTRVTPADQSADHYGSNFADMSEDGTRVLFSRFDSLAATDTDNFFDLYLATLTPTASIRDAGDVTHAGATLNGVASGDPAGTYHFEYGTTDAYGASTPDATVPAGAGLHAVSAAISGLAPSTTYHFRLVVTSAPGTTNTSDGTFTTAATPPPADNGNGNGNGNNGDGNDGDGGNGGDNPPPSFAGVLLGGGTVKVSTRGVAQIKVRCPAAAQGNCAGTLTLTAKLRGKSRNVGAARFQLAPGSSETVKVKLSKPVRKLIARGRTVKATATALARDNRNVNATTAEKLKLKRAARTRAAR